MQWSELVVHLPETTPFTPDSLRHLLAKLSAEAAPHRKLPSEVFGPSIGRGHNPFRFGGSKGALHLCAVGAAETQQLESFAHRVTSLLGRHFGVPLPDHFRSGRYPEALENRPFLYDYRIPCLVFEPRTPELVADLKAQVLTPRVVAHLEKVIRKGLERQADYLGVALPDHYTLGDLQFSADKGYFVPVKCHGSMAYVGARNLLLRCSLDLRRQPWHVGSLTGRGYGHLRQRGGDA